MLQLLDLSTPAPTGEQKARVEPGFEAWWRQYPRKVAKRAAERAWAKLSRLDREAAIAAIGAHADDWRRRYGAERTYIPHPATWLNGARWEDELDPIVAEPRPAAPPIQAWWTSDAMMEAKGREIGIGPARPGWTREEYRARINAAIERQGGRAA